MSPNLPSTLSPIPATPTWKLDDIRYALARHKWRIAVCTVVGLLVSAGVYRLQSPPYQSEALLFIRYVVDSGTPGTPGSEDRSTSPDSRGDTIIATEVAILRSLDIAYLVADAVGADKFPDAGNAMPSRDRAAFAIQQGLTVEPVPVSSVIRLIYRGPEATAVQPVLAAVVDAYLKKHVEIHRRMGAVGDFLFQETDQYRAKLSQTEESLRVAKAKAGVNSLEVDLRTYAEQLDRVQQEIFSAEAELADRSATLDALGLHPAPAPLSSAAPTPGLARPAPAQVEAYRAVRQQLAALEISRQKQLLQFTAESERVRSVSAQIDRARAECARLEKTWPALLAVATPAAPTSSAELDWQGQQAHLIGLRSRIGVLKAERDQVREALAKVEQSAAAITALQRQQALDETNYRYYSAHLEGARIDEALGAGRAVNIAVIQAPSPPLRDWRKTMKMMGAAAGGGLALGLGWAILSEMYLDRSIRRVVDVERLLQIPLFLSIPDLSRSRRAAEPYHDALRDRLIGYFESRGLTHKPKLVAVTGVGHQGGVTSTAAGLARSLSQTGDGNVLLVDMTAGRGSARQFCHGKAECGLEEILDTREKGRVEENLFVVVEQPSGEKPTRARPSQVHRLLPLLKASNFDYIIFDMPSVDAINVTPRLAAAMDIILLVIEAEKTDRDLAQRALGLLLAANASVGAVLNKSRDAAARQPGLELIGTS